MEGRPLIYGHRGARLELPENTLPSFERALDVGADALEMDVHMTRDGVIVVLHDEDGVRVANDPARVRDSSWAAVRRWRMGGDPRFGVPTFEEVLRAFPGARLNVDAKQEEPDIIPALLRLIRREGAEDRVRLASFSGRNLRRVRALGYEGETGLAATEIARLLLSPLSVLRAFPLAGRAAQIPTRQGPLDLTRPALIAKCHALGLRVDYWTIDDPGEARRLFERGADGFITDDPRALCAAFPGRGVR